VTTLVVYEESGRDAPLDATDDPAGVTTRLAALGVGFGRRDASLTLPADADQDFILKAYAETIEALCRKGGYKSVDVFRLLPHSPHRAAWRRKYLAEHTHGDDEVRFFVEGGGAFFLRDYAKVVEVRVERGDLLYVPAGTRHWFDAGDPPYCTAIRLFTRPNGWIGAFTGDAIADRFAPAPA
jgi:1,2-dihydroxy-3-keto-5-methylthiopentene dioxygenase